MHTPSRLTYKHTLLASYIGYLVQALVINYPPLLFLTFRESYGISLSAVSSLIAFSFAAQLCMDFLASRLADKCNLRFLAVFSLAISALGMVFYAILPDCFASLGCPMVGLCLATACASIGGGLIEVVISPLVEACPTPTDEKGGVMSLLHSFYCWGQAGTVLLSTLFFAICGIQHWRILSALWGLLPAIGALAFLFVPIYSLSGKEENPEADAAPAHCGQTRTLFWLFCILMVCAGAAEQVMSQWTSSFAESALGIDKTAGDLFGPMCFALLMGLVRTFYGKNSRRIRLLPFMFGSLILCTVSYGVAAFSPFPIVSLAGCTICGMAVAILWPGIYAEAARHLHSDVRMFATLALAGDIGCLLGPTLAGFAASLLGGDMHYAFLFSLIFPIVSLIVVRVLSEKTQK